MSSAPRATSASTPATTPTSSACLAATKATPSRSPVSRPSKCSGFGGSMKADDGGKGARIANLVVGGLIGVALLYLAYAWAGWKWGTILTLLGAYEGWAISNRYSRDTLSEAIWRFAQRPFIPWAFGCVTGTWLIVLAQQLSGLEARPFRETYADIALLCVWLFLQGHFFFQRGTAADAARGETGAVGSFVQRGNARDAARRDEPIPPPATGAWP